MTNRQEFALSALAMTLIAVVLATPAGCTIHRNAQLTKAIESGVDPLEAKCALDSHSQDIPCILVAAGKGASK